MYRLVNVPHANNKRAQLTPSVEQQTVYIKVIDPQTAPPFNASLVCDMFIGDHMFTPEMRNDLRMMVGRALVTAIEHARDIGYRQAQSEIRDALGIPRL
jgi:hypothetical protein